MSNWWDAAPVADDAAEWWKDAPVADVPKPAPPPAPKPVIETKTAPVSKIETPGEDKSVPFGSLGRGFNRLQQAATMLQQQLGVITPEEAAKAMARDEADAARFPMSPAGQRGMQEISEAEGFMDSAKAIARNPGAVMSTVGESLVQSVAPIVAGIVGSVAGAGAGSIVPGIGTAAGAVAGGVSGGAAGSFALEYSAAMSDAMREANVDLSNEQAVLQAFADPAIMEAGRLKGIRRGIPIAVLDGLSMGIGGKIAGPVLRATEGLVGKTAGKVAAGTAELGVQSALGGAGEAGAQLVDEGEISSPGSVLLEAVAETVTGVPEIGIGLARDAMTKPDTPPPPAAPAAPLTPPPAAPAQGQYAPQWNATIPQTSLPAPDPTLPAHVNAQNLTNAILGGAMEPEAEAPAKKPLGARVLQGLLGKPDRIPAPQPQPAAAPQNTELAPVEAPISASPEAANVQTVQNGQFDLTKPLEGEEPITIMDPETNQEEDGYWHKATNKVRRIGEEPDAAVMAAQTQTQPKPDTNQIPTQPEPATNQLPTEEEPSAVASGVDPVSGVPSPANPGLLGVPPVSQPAIPDNAAIDAAFAAATQPPAPEAVNPGLLGTPAPQDIATTASQIDGGNIAPATGTIPVAATGNPGAAQGGIEGQQPAATALEGQAPQGIPADQGSPVGSPVVDQGDGNGNGAAGALRPGDAPAVGGVKSAKPIARRSVQRDTVQTPTGKRFDAEYAMVELEDLIPSNFDDGRVNPAYPQERQPRDRTKGAYEQQILKIMRDFDPRQLDKSPTSDDGAPIIDQAGVVESGNGRAMTLTRIYRDRPDLADKYRQHLQDQGYDIAGMKNPVLVRVRETDMTPAEIAEYTRASNTDNKASMSATEQAMSDAKALPDTTLDLFRGGDIDTAANRDFVKAFQQHVVPENERGKMVDESTGALSQDAVRRIQATLLAKAYEDSDLVASMIESTDSDTKTIGGALLDVSGEWAKMRSSARTGLIAAEADSTSNLIEALRMVQRARREQIKLGLLVNQKDIFSGDTVAQETEQYLTLFFRNTKEWSQPVGREKLGEVLRYIVGEAMKTAPGADIFGSVTDAGALLTAARKKLESLYDDGKSQQADIFANSGGDTRQGDGKTGERGAGSKSGAAQDGAGASGGRPSESQRQPEEVINAEQPASPAKPATSDFNALDAAFDAVAAPAEAKPAKPKAAAADPEDAAAASENLNNLFNEDETDLVDFDQELYAKAKPNFRVAMRQFSSDVNDNVAVAKVLIDYLIKGGLTREGYERMKPYLARYMQDLRSGKETLDVPGSSGSLEPDRGGAAATDAMGAADVPAADRADGASAGSRGEAPDKDAGQRDAGVDLPENDAGAVGARSDLQVPQPPSEPDGRNPADREPERGGADSVEGLSPDTTPAATIVEASSRSPDLKARIAAQKSADNIPVKPGIANIRETLPVLHPMQQEDVEKIEARFAKGPGMLVTNGTGTGKTYSGLGVVKRFAKQGKDNILIVAPSQGILDAWAAAAPNLGLKVSIIENTQTAGKGIVLTTYANLASNLHLGDRKWDLVVADEAHSLSANAQGEETANLRAFRALTGHPEGYYRRADMELRDLVVPMEELAAKIVAISKTKTPVPASMQERYDRLSTEFYQKREPLLEKYAAEERTQKALMLSATPFAHHFSLDYAEGYLFDYPEVKQSGAYNAPSGRDQFYIENLGYQKRYGKLTKPDAKVDTGVMERQFHEKLRKEGALSGRMLEVERDYDRKFVAVHDNDGSKIDEAFKWLSEFKEGGFKLAEIYQKKFDYLSRARLLEAIKAKASINYIEQNLAMGRKAIVFHNFNEGGGFKVFESFKDSEQVVTYYAEGMVQKETTLGAIYDAFIEANPYVEKLNFSDYQAPMHELAKHFGSRAGIYNGTVSKKVRSEALAKFNTEGSGLDVLVIQADAGSAGLSAHDTIGKTPRVLVNLGLPTKPTAAIQQEGRIYRDGQKSDAMFRYFDTGTTWERMAFASTIAQRASTAENFAMGDLARTLKQSFIDAYAASDDYKPGFEGEGTGGKAIDRAARETMSPFKVAKTHYYANQKKTAATKAAEGADYFATPEPLGLKMVEWAGIKPGDSVLEPSAGHGAISRYFPSDARQTIVEPSAELLSRAMLYTPDARHIQDRFENLAIVNKYDAIIMNPPFGTGGKLAMEHLAKAVKHLKNGGRVVALLPDGPAMQKRFDAWIESDEAKDIATVRQALLPSVTFKRAGTGVMTTIVVLEKQADKEVRAPQMSRRDYSDAADIEELFDRIEDSEVPPRTEPLTKDADPDAIPEDGEYTAGDLTFRLRKFKPQKLEAKIELASYAGKRWPHVKQMATEMGGVYTAETHHSFTFSSLDARNAFLVAFDANPNPPEAAETIEASNKPVEFEVATGYHKQRMRNTYVATPKERVTRERYSEIANKAKELGGYWSSFKGNGAIVGFQFDTAEKRDQFVASFAEKPGFSETAKGRELAFVGTSNFKNPRDGGQLGDRAQAHVVKYGKENGKEHLIIVDDEGLVVAEGYGGETNVVIPDEAMAAMDDPAQNIVVHHNHPSGRSFSTGDIVQFYHPGMAVVYAHGHSGFTYRAELAPGVRDALKAMGKIQAYNFLTKTTNAVSGARQKVLQDLLNAGKLSYNEAVEASGHLNSVMLHEMGLILYDTDYKSAVVEVPEVAALIAKVKRNFQPIIKELLKDGKADGGPAGLHRRAERLRLPGDMARIPGASREVPGRRNAEGAPSKDSPSWGGLFRKALFGESETDLTSPVDNDGNFDPENPSILAEDAPDLVPGFEAPRSNLTPPPWHVPDRTTFDHLTKGNGSIFSRIKKGFSAEALNTTFDEARVRLQDRFLPMMRVEEAIEAHTGTALPEGMKVYLAEELYTGRVGAKLDRITRRYMEPVAALMRENDIDQDMVNQFLYARHAKERNARIAAINTKFPDAGSGMSDAEADAILATVAGDPRSDKVERIGRMIDRLLRESVRLRVEAGLLSQEQADQWQEYDHYVPLRGWEEIDEDEPGMPNVGKGFSVRGKESKMALGRKSKAGDILATAFSVAQEAVIRAEKNRVVQRLYDLARANPNKAIWEINPVRMKQYFNRATGMVYSKPELPIAAQDAEKTVSVKFNGKEHRIVINEPRLRDAVKRLNAEDLNGVLKFMIGVNRWLSTVNTSLNPEFVISNAIRDIQAAGVRISTMEVDALGRKVLGDYRKAMAGAWGGLRGKPLSTEWRKWFDEFNSAGGKVSFFKMESIEDLKGQFDAMSRQMSNKDPRKAWRGVKAVGQFIEDMNMAVDNAVRLSLYKNLRQAGMSKDEAASAAKNLTVNFNRRGQWATTMNALYLFYNAGVQGTAVMVNTLRNKRAQKLAAAMVVGGFALDMLNQMISGDDDNEEKDYDKIPEYEKQRNLVIMLPEGYGFLKFPLPYGYNVFWNMGRKVGEYGRGQADAAEALGSIATTFIDSFNPVGGTESLLKLISPTITDPFVEITENQDFAGRKIRPDRTKYDENMPFSQDYYGSVSPHSRWLASMLNEWTGGNEFKPGAIDLSPEWIDHGAAFMGGAAASFWMRPVNAAGKMIEGTELNANDIPFSRKVYGTIGNYYDRNIYYDRVDKIEAAAAQTDGFRKKGDRAGFEALDTETRRLGAMRTTTYKEMVKRMGEIRKKRNEVYGAPLDAAERSKRLKTLEDAEMRIINQFNRAYLRATKN